MFPILRLLFLQYIRQQSHFITSSIMTRVRFMCVQFICNCDTITHICLPTSLWWFPILSKAFLFSPAEKANSSDGCQPHTATPHHVQPNPAHAHLRWLLSFRTDSACLPQLSNIHAGTVPDQNKQEPLMGKFSLKTKAYYTEERKDGWIQFLFSGSWYCSRCLTVTS